MAMTASPRKAAAVPDTPRISPQGVPDTPSGQSSRSRSPVRRGSQGNGFDKNKHLPGDAKLPYEPLGRATTRGNANASHAFGTSQATRRVKKGQLSGT